MDPNKSGIPARRPPGPAHQSPHQQVSDCGDPDCLQCLARLQAEPFSPPPARQISPSDCRDCRDVLVHSTSITGQEIPDQACLLLISDRLAVARELLVPALAALNVPIKAQASAAQLAANFASQTAAIVIVDLPRAEALELMAGLFRHDPDAVVLVMGREMAGQDPPEWQRAGAFACFQPTAPAASLRELVRRGLCVAAVQTDRRLLRQRLVIEKNTNRSTLRHLPMGILILDPDLNVISCNPALERLTGLRARDLPSLPQLLCRVVPDPSSRHKLKDVVQQVCQEAVALRCADLTFVRASDESRRQVAVQVAPLPEETGSGAACVLILQDVTTERRLARQLVQNERLVAIGEMAASVAHELKNPLAGITGALDLVMAELPVRSDLNRIRHEVQVQLRRLNELSSDLLNFAKPVQVEVLQVRFRDLVRSITATLAHDPSFKGREVCIEGTDVVVAVDGIHFPLVLQNLLVNAAQAAPAPAPIRVGAERTRNGLRMWVEDQGPGIPEDLRQRVFVPFYTTKHKGTGLGLPICRKIVEAHGGTIDIARAHQGGTRMVLNLPSLEE